MPYSVWDLSFPTRELNPCPLLWKLGVLINHWTAKEVPLLLHSNWPAQFGSLWSMYIVTYSRHFFFCFYIFILKFKIHRKVVKVALETPLYLSLSLPIVTILPHLPYSLYTHTLKFFPKPSEKKVADIMPLMSWSFNVYLCISCKQTHALTQHNHQDQKINIDPTLPSNSEIPFKFHLLWHRKQFYGY